LCGAVIWECEQFSGCVVVMCEGGMDGVTPQLAKRQPPDGGPQGSKVVRAIELPASHRPTAGLGQLPGGGLYTVEMKVVRASELRASRRQTACQGRLPGGLA
jgi:hypothetical protein